MSLRILGIYREAEFSPGKVSADRAIMDAVLAHLRTAGAATETVEGETFGAESASGKYHAVLAMCQGSSALAALAAAEKAGTIVVNSALAIRNCYRDLLGPGLINSRVPTPRGSVVPTAEPVDLQSLRTLDLTGAMYVKRGDLHALGPEDVQRVAGEAELEETLRTFGRRGIRLAYVQQEVVGGVVKFYGVGNGNYFAIVPEAGNSPISAGLQRDLAWASGTAARALGLEVWGGDAIVRSDDFSIVDLNDWPSFALVREEAALAIARRLSALLRSQTTVRDLQL
jgi:hypothetical protein